MYGGVHFVWTIDYYEAGGNSDWLLPNRLYEGPLHGAVPLTLRNVEAGRWLHRRGCGVLLGEPVEENLAAFLANLDARHYAECERAVAGLSQ
jgi:succinoglycan biosynthesis protein ExoL